VKHHSDFLLSNQTHYVHWREFNLTLVLFATLQPVGSVNTKGHSHLSCLSTCGQSHAVICHQDCIKGSHKSTFLALHYSSMNENGWPTDRVQLEIVSAYVFWFHKHSLIAS